MRTFYMLLQVRGAFIMLLSMMHCLLPCNVRDAPLLQASFTLWRRATQTIPDFWHHIQGREVYHQTQWKVGPRPKGTKEIFNRTHSSLRSVIEQSFGMLKMKWRILLGLPHYSERRQAKIILACCGLHNFILENDSDDLHYHMDEQEEAWAVDEDDADETGNDAAVDDDVNMNELRDEIARGCRLASRSRAV